MESTMKPTSRKRNPLHFQSLYPLLLTLMILLNGCSSGLKLTSDWQPNEMKINGTDSDWQRGLYYDKGSDMAYGVRNDDRYVYLFLKTQNRSTQRQIMRSGLTVWFDREDGKNHTFGIQYPTNRQKSGPGYSPDTNEERLNPFLDQAFPELAIVGPNKENVQLYSALEAPGILVKLGRQRDALIYELQVPIKKTHEHPFAIEPLADHRIGIEFETGEFKPEHNDHGMPAGNMMNHGREMGDGNPPDRGLPGDERRPYGGGDQGDHFGKLENNNQMELWLSVQLVNP